MLQVGEKMPAFAVRNAQREEVTQEAFAGSPAVLAFFPMAFTGG
jgi:peroxiredoxin